MKEGWDATGLLLPLWTPLGGRDKLAVLAGITPATLSAYNSGARKLGIKNAKRIAAATGVSLVELGQPAEEASDPRSQTLRGRLEELEDALAQAVKAQTTMGRQLARLQARVSKLEAQPVPRPDVAGSADG